MEKNTNLTAMDVVAMRDPNSEYGKQTASFEQTHQEELGVKRYLTLGVRDTVLPLGAALIGGFGGYALLHRPMRALAPGFFDGLNVARQIPGKIAGKTIDENIQLIREAAKEAAGITVEADNKSLGKVLRDVWKQLATPEKRQKFLDALGIEKVNPFAEKWAAAAAGYVTASIPVSIAIGYDDWKRKEMPRIAAREVNEDIANLQLFQPTDQELQAEVVRLREMVDKQTHANAATGASPQTTISTADGVDASRLAERETAQMV